MTVWPADQDKPNTGDTTQAEPAARAGTPARRDEAAARAAGPDTDSVPDTDPERNTDAGPDTDAGPAGSTELVMREPATAVPIARARRWPHAVAGLGRRLPQVLRHPAAVVSASVAATVATRLLVSGLRQATRPTTATGGTGGTGGTGRAGAGGPIAVAGYVLHEVHVIHHHVVHHHVVHRTDYSPLA